MDDVKVTFNADSAEALNAMMKLNANIDKLGTKLEQAGQKSKKAGDEGKSAWRSMAGEMMGAITAMGAVSRFQDELVKGFQRVRDASKEALQSSRDIDKPSRQLSQLAGGDPQVLRQLHKQRDDLAQKYGIEREQAAQMVFASKSAELNASEIDYAAKSTLIGGEAASSAEFMGATKQAFKGEVDPKQALAVALASSAKSAKLNLGDVTTNLPSIMNPAKQLGLSMEETAALYSETSDHFTSGSQTADRAKMLLGKLALNEKFQGRGLAGLEELAAMDDKALQDESLLGKDAEKWQALNAIRAELPDIKAAAEKYKTVAAETGTAKDAVDATVRTQLSLPGNVRALQLRRAEVKQEVLREQRFAGAEGKTQQAWIEEQTRLQGLPLPLRVPGEAVAGGLAGLGADEDVVRAGGAAGEFVGRQAIFGGDPRKNWAEVSHGLYERESKRAGAGGDQHEREALIRELTGINKTLEEINGKTVRPSAKAEVQPIPAGAAGLNDK